MLKLYNIPLPGDSPVVHPPTHFGVPQETSAALALWKEKDREEFAQNCMRECFVYIANEVHAGVNHVVYSTLQTLPQTWPQVNLYNIKVAQCSRCRNGL